MKSNNPFQCISSCVKSTYRAVVDWFKSLYPLKKKKLRVYNKPALSVSQQVSKLISENLIVSDSTYAELKLTFISFHRLNGYTKEFRVNGDYSSDFSNGTTFETIVSRYTFDREIRLLLTDALERIEISVRTVMTNVMSSRHGTHWYMNETLFSHKIDYYSNILQKIRDEVIRSKNESVREYHNNYDSPSLPPIFIISEVITFGKWSIMYANLHDADKKEISKVFGFYYKEMESWLESLSNIRNSCAHHAHLWNRRILKGMAVKMLSRYGYIGNHPVGNSLYATCVIIQIFLYKIAKDSKWKDRLKDLILNKYPNIPVDKIGFPAGWENNPFWN